jgi:hypothetical protein
MFESEKLFGRRRRRLAMEIKQKTTESEHILYYANSVMFSK